MAGCLACTACSCLTKMLCCKSGGDGNSKKDGEAPNDESVGRKRSLLVIAFSVVWALIMQHYIAPEINPDSWGLGGWGKGECSGLVGDELDTCEGDVAVLRMSMASATFFLLMAGASAGAQGFNGNHWTAKAVLYVVIVLGYFFCPNNVFDNNGYAWVARIGSMFFLILQCVILIDFAYGWNEAWVNNADEADAAGAEGGQKWLGALLFASGILYIASFTGIVLLFQYFRGCSDNEFIISLTLIFGIVLTFVQLRGEEGSLLTSAIVIAYSVWLAYSSVSNNDNDACNPMLNKDQSPLNITFGMLVVTASVAWVCYSTSNSLPGVFQDGAGTEGRKEKTRTSEKNDVYKAMEDGDGSTDNIGKEEKKSSAEIADSPNTGGASAEDDGSGIQWKFNLIMVFASFYFGMILTNWADSDAMQNASNATAGKATMWMTITAQWITCLLYLWSMVAPKLFPDRDFS